MNEADTNIAINLMADEMEKAARTTGPFAYWIAGDKTALATRALQALQERFTITAKTPTDESTS